MRPYELEDWQGKRVNNDSALRSRDGSQIKVNTGIIMLTQLVKSLNVLI